MDRMNRRTLVSGLLTAPVVAATTANATPLSEDTSRFRVDTFAEAIGLEPPQRLLSNDGAPSEELLAFCNETGLSLDWVFADDLKAMCRAVYHDHQTQTLERTPEQRLEYHRAKLIEAVRDSNIPQEADGKMFYTHGIPNLYVAVALGY